MLNHESQCVQAFFLPPLSAQADVDVKVGVSRFLLHPLWMMTDVVSRPLRLVLSSVSDYFAAMFTSDVREAKQDEVKMEGVDPDALWVLVQYAYTGK